MDGRDIARRQSIITRLKRARQSANRSISRDEQEELERLRKSEADFKQFRKDMKHSLNASLRDNQKIQNEKAQMKDTLTYVENQLLLLEKQHEFLKREHDIMIAENKNLISDMNRMMKATGEMEVYKKEIERLENEEAKRREVQAEIKKRTKQVAKLEKESAKQLRDTKRRKKIDNLVKGKPSHS